MGLDKAELIGSGCCTPQQADDLLKLKEARKNYVTCPSCGGQGVATTPFSFIACGVCGGSGSVPPPVENQS